MTPCRQKPWLAGPMLSLLLVTWAGCVTPVRQDARISVPAPRGEPTSPRESFRTLLSPEAGKTIPFPQRIAVPPFLDHTSQEYPLTLVRQRLVNQVAQKSYQVTPWPESDAKLAAAGITNPDEAASRDPAELCRLLGVDGLLLGEITHYAPGETEMPPRLGVRLRLLDAAGHLLWLTERQTRTLSDAELVDPTTPLGRMVAQSRATLSSRERGLLEVADNLGVGVAAEMPEPPQPSGKPRLAIRHVAHDGVGRILRNGDILSLLLDGTPAMAASVRIPGLRPVPLTESSQTPGLYTARVVFGPDENVELAPVVGILRDSFGVVRENVASPGSVTVDNRPPGPVTELTLRLQDNTLVMNWQPSPDPDVRGYQIAVASAFEGPFTVIQSTTGVQHVLPDLPLPRPTQYYRVVAVDRAGNRSTEVIRGVDGVGDEAAQSEKILFQRIPALIDGPVRLTSATGPYHLAEPAMVTERGLLVIEAGTRILVHGRAALTVRGGMTVLGDQERPVVVEPADPAGFATFLILESRRSVVLQGMEIHQGGVPLVIAEGAPRIIDSRIVESRTSAMEIRGASQPFIEGCTLQGGDAGAVIVMGQAKPRIFGNRFVGNAIHLQSFLPHPLDLRNNSWQPPASRRNVLGLANYE
ncbi:MAG: fibronectin type III domain-containing protein [Magnetococcales bacterium]|nr:fibronectin type III domain-containing protein [Magnetococcales bacterium]